MHSSDTPTNDAHVIRITESVNEQIKKYIGSRKAEQGGALGGTRDDYVVREFYYDDSANRSSVTYSPDHTFINHLLEDVWKPRKIFLLGFIHSHPGKMGYPSGGDEIYATDILLSLKKLKYLLLPIVTTIPDAGDFTIHPFAAFRSKNGVHIERFRLEIVRDDFTVIHEKDSETATSKSQEQDTQILSISNPQIPEFIDLDETFARVTDAYDLERMAKSRVIAVGTGGAASFIENLARSGIGQFVLIDPDVTELKNVGTQQVYRQDIGQFKVANIERRIKQINPNAVVLTIEGSLDDINDEVFAEHILGNWKGGIPEKV